MKPNDTNQTTDDKAPQGYTDQQLYEAQQKIKKRAPILFLITGLIIGTGTLFLVAVIAFFIVMGQQPQP